MGKKYCSQGFISELYKRTSDAPIKATDGSRFIAVDLRGSSREFSFRATLFLEDNPEIFRILIRGHELYVELLDGHSLVDACQEPCVIDRNRLN